MDTRVWQLGQTHLRMARRKSSGGESGRWWVVMWVMRLLMAKVCLVVRVWQDGYGQEWRLEECGAGACGMGSVGSVLVAAGQVGGQERDLGEADIVKF